MSNSQISLYTLLPKSNDLHAKLKSVSHLELPQIAAAFMICAFISFVYELVILLITISQNASFTNKLIIVISDVCRMLYYLSVLLMGRRFKTYQLYGTYIFPPLCVAIMTETYVYAGDQNKIIPR